MRDIIRVGMIDPPVRNFEPGILSGLFFEKQRYKIVIFCFRYTKL